MESGRLRIAVIGSVLVPFDAISNDIVSKAGALAGIPGSEVSVLVGHCGRQDIEAKVIPRLSDLLLAPEFLDADVIVYHFGIYYPLFDAILVGNGRARQAVVFHNITPLEFIPASGRRTIEKSFAQLDNLHAADAIWPDSRENAEMLLRHGIDGSKITIQPLAVGRPPRQSIRKKVRATTLQILFIGRIVPAKGIQDLVEALALLDTACIRVRIIGNLDAAEVSFREAMLARAAELGLSGVIEFVGLLSDDDLDHLLMDSHVLAVPSYHEGFCVPVIEALRAGVLPVVYSAHNLRYIADGLCVSAPVGDVAGFAAALSSAVADVQAVLADPATATLRLERGPMSVADFELSVADHLEQFEPAVTARQLCRLVGELAGSNPH